MTQSPFDNAPFAYTGPIRQQAGSVTIWRRYQALGRALHERNTQRVLDASVLEGVNVLPNTMVLHLAHNWHLCAHGEGCLTSQALLRQRRTATWLYYREEAEAHGADHPFHVAAGEAGWYLWCEGCKSLATQTGELVQAVAA